MRLILIVLLSLLPSLSLAQEIPYVLPMQSGCCSWHRGVCGCANGRQVCCDGSYSPTCRCTSPEPKPTATPHPIEHPTRWLTPGHFSTSDLSILCVDGYASKAPRISASLRNKVATRYNLKSLKGSTINRLIPFCLGGDNNIENLWPVANRAFWNAKDKADLDRWVCPAACTKQYPLNYMRNEIKRDWTDLNLLLKPTPTASPYDPAP